MEQKRCSTLFPYEETNMVLMYLYILFCATCLIPKISATSGLHIGVLMKQTHFQRVQLYSQKALSRNS